jgi:hypothetical protein
MEFVYKYIGFVVFWFAGIVTSLYLLSKLFEWGINMLAKRYKPMWWIMEYVYKTERKTHPSLLRGWDVSDKGND